MSDLQYSEKIEHVRQRLVRLVQSVIRQDMSYEERMRHVIFVSYTDSSEYEEYLSAGGGGEKLRDLYMTEGLNWVHPLFFGHTVFWYAPKTKISKLEDLSRDELLAVIDKQKSHLKVLYDRRVVIKG